MPDLLTRDMDLRYHSAMIETLFFCFGLGFSLFVLFHSIMPLDLPNAKKCMYFILSLVGITGTLFLSGVLIAHVLRRLGINEMRF